MTLKEKKLSLHGCTIHYWVKDNRQSSWIVFLHGAGADHSMFDAQVKANINDYNLLLWDARGHGLSRPVGDSFSMNRLVGDLVAIMTHEKIETAIFVGQSMGGNIVQEILFRHPDKANKVVLVNCTCNTAKLSHFEKFLLKLSPSILNSLPWKYMIKQIAKASAVKPEVQSYLKQTFSNIGKKDFVKIFSETAKSIHYEQNYRLSRDALLIYGEHDRTGNIKKALEKWAQKDPKCRLIKIPDAGHCSNMDNPEEFNKALSDFLSRPD